MVGIEPTDSTRYVAQRNEQERPKPPRTAHAILLGIGHRGCRVPDPKSGVHSRSANRHHAKSIAGKRYVGVVDRGSTNQQQKRGGVVAHRVAVGLKHNLGMKTPDGVRKVLGRSMNVETGVTPAVRRPLEFGRGVSVALSGEDEVVSPDGTGNGGCR